MADVAVISVISSGVVGILGAAAGFYGQRVALHNARESRHEAQRDDLRSVLDGAAEAAFAFLQPFGDREATFGAILSKISSSPPELSKQAARIGVRVGTDSPAFERFNEAIHGVVGLTAALEVLPPDLTLRQAAGSEELKDAWDTAAEAVDRVNNSIAEFLNACSELVGMS